jgi:hypothetical protein
MTIIHDYAPADIQTAIAAFEARKAEAEQQLAEAQSIGSFVGQQIAQLWIDSFDRDLIQWRAALDRQVRS